MKKEKISVKERELPWPRTCWTNARPLAALATPNVGIAEIGGVFPSGIDWTVGKRAAHSVRSMIHLPQWKPKGSRLVMTLRLYHHIRAGKHVILWHMTLLPCACTDILVLGENSTVDSNSPHDNVSSLSLFAVLSASQKWVWSLFTVESGGETGSKRSALAMTQRFMRCARCAAASVSRCFPLLPELTAE